MRKMLQSWRYRRGRNDVDSQRPSDQVRVIRRNGPISDLEIENIEKMVTELPNNIKPKYVKKI